MERWGDYDGGSGAEADQSDSAGAYDGGFVEGKARHTRSRSNEEPMLGGDRPISTELADHRRRLEGHIEHTSRGKQFLRKTVTGRPDLRVRDFVKVPRVVRTIDKVSFTFGVLGTLVSHHLALVFPHYFWAWYTSVLITLLTVRLRSYRRKKWHYFMLDFCYYANALCMVNIFILPRSTALFLVNFCFSNGPILTALVAWRNSLVFHDLDKVTSVFLHALPAILTWCWRWHGMGSFVVHGMEADQTSYRHIFFYVPMLLYVVWQLAYLVKTEVLDRRKFQADPELVTSLRWLALDEKQPMNKLACRFFRKVGILKKGEKFDPNTTKTKVLFVILQLIFTITSLLPTPLLYHWKTLHASVILLAFITCTWNGASYYIEVFSRRYIKKFSESSEDEAQGSNADYDSAPTQLQRKEH